MSRNKFQLPIHYHVLLVRFPCLDRLQEGHPRVRPLGPQPPWPICHCRPSIWQKLGSASQSRKFTKQIWQKRKSKQVSRQWKSNSPNRKERKLSYCKLVNICSIDKKFWVDIFEWKRDKGYSRRDGFYISHDSTKNNRIQWTSLWRMFKLSSMARQSCNENSSKIFGRAAC